MDDQECVKLVTLFMQGPGDSDPVLWGYETGAGGTARAGLTMQ